MFSDAAWKIFEPLVEQAKQHKGGQPPVLSERMFFEAILYVARTGIPWRDLPGEFGAWDAVYNRFRRWEASGALQRLFALITAPELAEVKRVLVDSTTVRAHRHAAGALKKKARRLNKGLVAAGAVLPAKSW
jgi:putative transposase